MRLIVVNYSMRSNSLVFSHQIETVIALSRFFDTIKVFTLELGDDDLPNNTSVVKIPWKRRSPIANAWHIIKTLSPYLLKQKDSIVFTHMTDVHAAFISPLTRVLGIKHILWYAHATNSLYLIWSSLFVNNIVSSTPGSCNLRFSKRKIYFINQGINELDFPYSETNQKKSRKILYYGRLDKSKNIHQICRLARDLDKQGATTVVEIFGRPSNSQSDSYIASLLETNKDLIQNEIIQFKSAIPRKDIPSIAKGFEFFLNLFDGSLDKTLIETTMLGLPVITWNREYCEQFGTWSGMPPMVDLKFIHHEITALRSFSRLILEDEIDRRLKIAVLQHNFDGWIDRLVEVLKNQTRL